eukprot:6677153-Prymnesium_polylepis.1
MQVYVNARGRKPGAPMRARALAWKLEPPRRVDSGVVNLGERCEQESWWAPRPTRNPPQLDVTSETALKVKAPFTWLSWCRVCPSSRRVSCESHAECTPNARETRAQRTVRPWR